LKPDRSTRLSQLHQSLRLRAALGIALPVLLLLLALSWIHYSRESNLLEQQVFHTATQIGETTLASLRHVMLQKDDGHLSQILQDVGRSENIERLFLVGLDGRIAGDSSAVSEPLQFQMTDLGCSECHSAPSRERTHATMLQADPTTLRISTPIDNEPDCQICHAPSNHLGMLLIDVSLVGTRAQLLSDLTTDLGISFGFTLLITVGVYLLMQRLIVQRIERLQKPLAALASGNLSVRLPAPEKPRDEIDTLTQNVNHMADDLERYMEEREQLLRSRYQAMLEERERIAREMHDGVAQLMGYVKTKSNAIRINVESDKKEIALKQLGQLSSASQEAMLEMRASILGLRAIQQDREAIQVTLATFLQKFHELTEIEIESDLPQPEAEIQLSPESELHVLRITQEALTNIHKHSGVKQAHVSLRRVNGHIELSIRDRGDGFNARGTPSKNPFSFGLNNMRERAVAMGATFDIHTRPHEGTEILVVIPLEAK